MVKNLNGVKNQFRIEEGGMVVFQSYDSRICEVCSGSMGFDRVVRIGRDYKYSTTTKKHLYRFLEGEGLDLIANRNELEWAINRGYARLNQSIAVVYDPTMY